MACANRLDQRRVRSVDPCIPLTRILRSVDGRGIGMRASILLLWGVCTALCVGTPSSLCLAQSTTAAATADQPGARYLALALQELAQVRGSRDEALRDIAKAQLSAGDLRGADDTTSQIADAYARSSTYMQLGFRLLEQQRTEDAGRMFAEITDQWVAQALPVFRRPVDAQNIARLPAAQAMAQIAQDRDRGWRIQAYTALARNQHQGGQREQAEASAAKAVDELNQAGISEVPGAVPRVAGCLVEIGQEQRARQLADQYSDSGGDDLFEAMAVAFAARGEFDKTEELFARIESDSGKARAYCMAADHALTRGDRQQARVWCEKGLQTAPKEMLDYGVAVLLAELGEFAKARALVAGHSGYSPEMRTGVYALIAGAQATAGNPDAAAKWVAELPDPQDRAITYAQIASSLAEARPSAATRPAP